MKYSIKVNEVRAKEGSIIKGFATVVFGDSFKITNIAILVCYKGENGTKYCINGQKIFYKGYGNGFSRSNGWCFYKCNGSRGFS